MIVVFSRPGREADTAETVAQLESHGGGHALPHDEKTLFWVGESPPPRVPWRCICFPQRPAGSVADFWLLLRTLRGRALVVLEDDVRACRNALPYMEQWGAPTLSSFYNLRGFAPGPRLLDSQGFCYSQAIKLPAELVDALADVGPPPNVRDHDIAIGKRIGDTLVWYHRSLVRHVGAVRADGRRSPVTKNPADYVGDDFDALSLLTDRQGGA
jgi:hypothetical protein